MENNTSMDVGGGISIGTQRGSNIEGLNQLTMNGGNISENSSNGCGGGIYIADGSETDYGYAEITAGKIESNHASAGKTSTNNDFGGGGIYVNGSNVSTVNTSSTGLTHHNGELHIKNVLIAKNKALGTSLRKKYTAAGGGIASCPSSKTFINLNEGAAIYSNTAKNAPDVYICNAKGLRDHSGKPPYQVSAVMLGGTPYKWMLDPKNDESEYASLSDLNGINHEVKLHTETHYDETAERLAQVRIIGNSSNTSGGGIGSNGTVVIGVPEGKNTTRLSIEKNWVKQSGLEISDKIILSVYRKLKASDKDPAFFGSQYVTKAKNWRATITNLPAEDEDGNPYKYSVEESEIPGYTLDPKTGIFNADDGSGVKIASECVENEKEGFTIFTITNRQVTSLSVQKNWNDKNNQDGKRPDSLLVHLLANGEPKGDPVKLTATSDWKHTWKNLDAVDKNGNIIKYSVTEDTPSGYKQTSSAVASSNMSVTREKTSKDGVINVIISKQWPEGETHPKSLTVKLLADGKPIEKVQPAELNGSDNNKWTAKFMGLPEKNKAGSDIVYTAKVVKVGGYTSDVIKFGSASVTVTMHDSSDSTTIQLLANGTAIEGKTATLNEANNWTATIDGLEKYKNGEVIEYTAEKVTDSGLIYDWQHISAATSCTGEVGDFTIVKKTNQNLKSNVGYVISRTDPNGTDPESISFQIIDYKGNANSTMTLNADNNWQYTSGTSIPDGWTLRVSEVDGYPVGGITTASSQTVTFTNTHIPETVSVNGIKTWNDNGNADVLRPESIIVKLIGADNKEVARKTIFSKDDWKYSFTNLPKYSAGKEIAYRVEEEVDDKTATNYEATYNKDSYDITNSELIHIAGTKTWDDDNNKDDIRPASITVKLLADGKEIDSRQVTAANGWKYDFGKLPKYAEGKLIVYKVQEEMDERTAWYYDVKYSGYNIINTHTPTPYTPVDNPTREVSVTKTWDDHENQDGKRPTSVQVQLYADGKPTGDPVTLSAANTWQHSWPDLKKYTGDKEIVYTIKEVGDVTGYTPELTGDPETGFILTNKYTPKTTRYTVTKVWNDNNNAAKRRPTSIQVNLMQDGKVTGDPITLTEENGWKYEWKDLPKYKDGKELKYTCAEANVPNGYKSAITVTENGAVITNSYTDSGNKPSTPTVPGGNRGNSYNNTNTNGRKGTVPGGSGTNSYPNSNTKTGTTGSSAAGNANTGDSSIFLLYALLMVLSSIVAGKCIFQRRRNRLR